MMEKKQYIDFDSFDGERFRYRQKDGKILKLLSTEPVLEPVSKISFGIDYNRVREKLDNSLELLIINATSDCNLRCRYCVYSNNYIGEANYSDKTISEETAKKAIDHLFKHSQKIDERIISFYGGEPLLEKAKSVVIGSVEYARRLSIIENLPLRIAITTNGTTLTNWYNWFIENDVSLFLSLDGPEEIHDKWRGKGSFKKIIDGIEKIKRKDDDYFRRMVSFSSTFVDFSDLPDIRKFFNTNFPDNSIRLSSVRISGLLEDSPLRQVINQNSSKSRYEIYAKEYVVIISDEKQPDKFLKALFDQMLMVIYYRYRGNLDSPLWPTNTCVPGGKKLFVREDGRFYACEKAYGTDFEVGDVDSGVDFSKVSKLMEEYADACNHFCLECWAPRICGSCFMSIRKGENINREVMGEICSSKLKSLELGLKIYTTAVQRSKKGIEKYLNSLGHSK